MTNHPVRSRSSVSTLAREVAWAVWSLATLTAAAPLGVSGQTQVIPDTPQRRWEFFNHQRAFPFPQIPAGAYQAARMEAARIFLPAPPPVSGTQWQQLGPERIPTFIQSTGRLSTIAVDPGNSDVIYVGGAQGGVWKSSDAGVSWSPLTDDQCSLAMGSIAIDPVNTNIVYAGTGEQHFSGDSYYGCGVLRSDDGGSTWTTLGSSVFQSATGGAYIARVVVDPVSAGSTNGTTVLVASDGGLYRSTNSGATWSIVQVGTITDLVQDPADPAVLYSAGWGSGVYRTSDTGATWTPVNTGFPSSSVGRINLGLAPSDPGTLYASVQNSSTYNLLGIYKTVDAGGSWNQLSANGASCSTQCWYDMTLAVHPAGADTVYFGGVDLFKSTNGGTTFSAVTNGIHVDQHILVFDPADPSILYAGNDGGVYRTVNGGGSWASLNTNLSLTQFYRGVSLHPTDPTGVLGGTQDNGTLLHVGTPDWDFVLGGDGGYTAIDYHDPVTRYAETQWVPNSGYSGPRRSDGGSFNLKVNGINTSDGGLFIPPLVMDPLDPHTLYFGTSRLYQTTNRGENWNVISPTFSGDYVSAIAAVDSSTIYVGTAGGDVFVTFNGGDTWQSVSGGLPVRYISDIAVDATNPQLAYVVYSGFLTDHVYRTANGGATWQSVDGNLPDVPVNAILLDPGNSNTIFLGTDIGAYVTSNGGGTWVPFNNGLPNVAVFDLVYKPETGTMVAATHGRGMFALQMATSLYLDVTPTSRADTAFDGLTVLIPDSVSVVVGGTGSGNVGWSATHGGSSWLTLTSASGVGQGVLSWTRDPSGLDVGTYVDTIIVSAAGASGSPLFLVDSLVVMQFINIAVTPESRLDSVLEGSTSALPDSAAVVLTGTDPQSAAWSTSHGSANWLTLNTLNGVGSGPVYWTKNTSGLTSGLYVDTISVISAAIGSPATVVDSLVVLAPLSVSLSKTSVSDTSVVFDDMVFTDSLEVNPTGFESDSAPWTASSNGSRVTITSGNGMGSSVLRWSINADGLTPGVYKDTITVSVQGAATDPGRFVHTLVVRELPITLEAAIDVFLTAGTVSDDQQAYLDSRGNGDGVLNLGDLLAFIDRLNNQASALVGAPGVQREERRP